MCLVGERELNCGGCGLFDIDEDGRGCRGSIKKEIERCEVVTKWVCVVIGAGGWAPSDG